MFVILGLSYYVRGAHRPAALAQAAPLHRAGLGARRRATRSMMGTDAGAAWFLLAAALVVLPAGALLVRRLHPGGRHEHEVRLLRLALRRLGATPSAVADARRQPRELARASAASAPTSELSRLNADPREVVPGQPDDGAPARARSARPRTRPAASSTARCWARSRPRATRPTSPRRCRSTLALRLAPPRRPAAPEPALPLARGRAVRRLGGAPPARRCGFDSGGLAKGLFADLIAERLRGTASPSTAAATCASAAAPRRLEVADPFGGPALHVFELRDGAVATSGIGRRSWLGADGRPAHHLLDPATGRARVHRRRPGDGARAHRRRGRVARQGRGAQRRRAAAGSRTAASSCSTTAPTSSPNPSPTPRRTRHEQARL